MTDFYENVLCLGLPMNVTIPDALSIGRENNKKEIGRLLQLILGAAVNCDHKEDFIAKIMSLDTETQLTVKQAIEELFLPLESVGRTRSGTTDSITCWDSLTAVQAEATASNSVVAGLRQEIKRLNDQLSSVTESKEKIAQEMFDIKRELSSIKEENLQLTMENDKLTNSIKRLESNSNQKKSESNAVTSESSDASLKEIFVNKLQTRIDFLTDDLFKMENLKEETRIKNELLEKELMDLRFKNEDLTRKAKEARNMKDELDILKQQAEKADSQQQTIEVLKKRLEEAADFRRKVKFSGDDNVVNESKLKIQLEEEMRKNSHLKTQIDNLKKQVSEMHTTLAQVNHSKESTEFEVRMLKEKYDYLLDEKENLVKEMSEMRRVIREKRPSLETHLTMSALTSGVNNLNHELNNIGNESRLKELERENQRLRDKLSSQAQVSEELGLNGGLPTSLESSNKVIESLRLEVYDYQQKVIQLEGILRKKEEDIAEMETRYRKSVNKAKQVAKVLEPISMTSSNSSINSMANFEQLAFELQMREKEIQELREAQHEKTSKEVDEKLMTTAFHSLASRIQKTVPEERVTTSSKDRSSLPNTNSNTGSNNTSNSNNSNGSFLSRLHRQTAARRLLGSNTAPSK